MLLVQYPYVVSTEFVNTWHTRKTSLHTVENTSAQKRLQISIEKHSPPWMVKSILAKWKYYIFAVHSLFCCVYQSLSSKPCDGMHLTFLRSQGISDHCFQQISSLMSCLKTLLAHSKILLLQFKRMDEWDNDDCNDNYDDNNEKQGKWLYKKKLDIWQWEKD